MNISKLLPFISWLVGGGVGVENANFYIIVSYIILKVLIKVKILFGGFLFNHRVFFGSLLFRTKLTWLLKIKQLFMLSRSFNKLRYLSKNRR